MSRTFLLDLFKLYVLLLLGWFYSLWHDRGLLTEFHFWAIMGAGGLGCWFALVWARYLYRTRSRKPPNDDRIP